MGRSQSQSSAAHSFSFSRRGSTKPQLGGPAGVSKPKKSASKKGQGGAYPTPVLSASDVAASSKRLKQPAKKSFSAPRRTLSITVPPSPNLSSQQPKEGRGNQAPSVKDAADAPPVASPSQEASPMNLIEAPAPTPDFETGGINSPDMIIQPPPPTPQLVPQAPPGSSPAPFPLSIPQHRIRRPSMDYQRQQQPPPLAKSPFDPAWVASNLQLPFQHSPSSMGVPSQGPQGLVFTPSHQWDGHQHPTPQQMMMATARRQSLQSQLPPNHHLRIGEHFEFGSPAYAVYPTMAMTDHSLGMGSDMGLGSGMRQAPVSPVSSTVSMPFARPGFSPSQVRRIQQQIARARIFGMGGGGGGGQVMGLRGGGMSQHGMDMGMEIGLESGMTAGGGTAGPQAVMREWLETNEGLNPATGGMGGGNIGGEGGGRVD